MIRSHFQDRSMAFNGKAFFLNSENLSWQGETREIKREHISVILNGWVNFMALDVFKGHISEMNTVGRVSTVISAPVY